MMVLTVLEASVAPGHEAALQTAFRRATSADLPPGLLRTDLLRDSVDQSRWRIQSLWESREALAAMRAAGTPAGVVMFRAAGAEPVLSVFEVVSGVTRGQEMQSA